MSERRQLSLRAFWREFVRVPNEARRLVHPVPHVEQARYLDAFDRTDATGMPELWEFVLDWTKKSGKTSTAAVTELWGLTSDGYHSDREVIISSTDEDQSSISFGLAAKMQQRHPWLRKHVRVLAREMVYAETVTDPRTGGQHVEEHVLRALPRDVRGLHGLNPSLTIFDEHWAQDDYDQIEALAPSPSRACPRVLYTSYAGLRSQQHPGNPWFDLLRRARRGDDPKLFYSRIGGPTGWQQIPWITPAWVAGIKRQFATVPAKFHRLVLNEPASSDTAFLTPEEIHDAREATRTTGVRVDPDARYALGLDLGLTHDWSAAVLMHIDAQRRAVVDLTRAWRGTPTAPVALAEVEEEIVRLAQRFPIGQIVMDAWQAQYLAQRLFQRGVRGVRTTTIDPAHLDRLATLVKAVFAERAILIPADAHDLIEQLETLEAAEMGSRNRRRDRLRFTSGKGTGAAAHDDLAIALSLALEVLEDRRRGYLRTCCVVIRNEPTFEPSGFMARLRKRKSLELQRQLEASSGGDRCY